MDLSLNNLQWLICYKTKPNQYANCIPCIENKGILGDANVTLMGQIDLFKIFFCF